MAKQKKWELHLDVLWAFDEPWQWRWYWQRGKIVITDRLFADPYPTTTAARRAAMRVARQMGLEVECD